MSYVIEQRDEQIVGTTANISYTLDFDRAPQHLVRVKMRVDNVASSTVTLVMPSWTPGSYKIRNYIGFQGNVVARIVKGASTSEAQFRWTGLDRLEITCHGASSVEVEYVVFGHERTVRTNHINRMHAFIVPAATLMYVDGRRDEIHHVRVNAPSKKWAQVSTQLSPVAARDENGVTLGALNFDILADSPIEIGNHTVVSFESHGAKHEIAVASAQKIDVNWIAEQTKVIIDTEAAVFGGVPYDRYVFIIHTFTGAGGGLEHARSSVNAVDPSALTDKTKGAAFLSLLCHEYFHLWNIKRIRPAELGPFDYTHPALTPMLWLAEGVTSYYDDLFAYRCGFYTSEEYLKLIATDHIAKLARVPGRFAMSVRDSSTLAWLKLYHESPDGTNRFPSYYLKGGLIFLLLDLYIIEHTDGKHSLDDGLKAFWKRYTDDPNAGMSEQECIAILERATGVQFREKLMMWLDGKDELPYAAALEPFGIAYAEKTKNPEAITFGEKRSFSGQNPKVFCGWRCVESGGRIIVKAIEDGAPAQLAGIGIDDEIIAVGNQRVTSVAQVEDFLSHNIGKSASLTCECDGRVYETSIAPQSTTEFSLTVNEQSTERQKMLRAKWLQRTS